MKKILSSCFAVALMYACGAPLAWAQTDPQAEMADAIASVEEMFAGVNEFVKDVRFDNGDVEQFVELWDEWSSYGDDMDVEDDDDSMDFDELIADSEYRAWAASHGLDAEDWARKSVRIMMVLYREQMMASAAEAPRQIEAQLAEIEAQRAQLGEEMYQQLKTSLEASVQVADAMMNAAKTLPQATAAEGKVLDTWRDELIVLMDSDDDDYDDYDDYYDEDEYGEDGEYEEDSW